MNKIRNSSLEGQKKYREGKMFEELFDRACMRERIDPVIFPMGGAYRGRMFIPMKTPCDRILLASQGRCIFIDCKSWGTVNHMSRSMLTPHQVMALNRFSYRDHIAGYVIWFRESNNVVFFTAKQLLWVLEGNGSLHWDRGLHLGSIEELHPEIIFKTHFGQGTIP